MEIINMNVGMLGTNCYILFEPDNPECIIIDPGDEPEMIFNRLNAFGLEPKYIVVTHGHPDHTGAIPDLHENWPDVRVMIHEADTMTTNRLGSRHRNPLEAFDGSDSLILLREGDEIRCGGIRLRVVHTPGHSPGGVCLISEEEGCVFTGDTLFNGSVGRSDFPGGNFNDLMLSIKEKLYCLPPETEVYPGHSQPTTIGEEMEYNPFVRGD